MRNKETMKLIDGHFANEDADELLTHIYSSEINFFNIRNLRSFVQSGSDDKAAQQTIATLNEEMRKLRSVLAEARSKRKKVVINSEVSISLVDSE